MGKVDHEFADRVGHGRCNGSPPLREDQAKKTVMGNINNLKMSHSRHDISNTCNQLCLTITSSPCNLRATYINQQSFYLSRSYISFPLHTLSSTLSGSIDYGLPQLLFSITCNILSSIQLLVWESSGNRA